MLKKIKYKVKSINMFVHMKINNLTDMYIHEFIINCSSQNPLRMREFRKRKDLASCIVMCEEIMIIC